MPGPLAPDPFELLDALDVAVLAEDGQGVAVYANRRLRELFLRDGLALAAFVLDDQLSPEGRASLRRARAAPEEPVLVDSPSPAGRRWFELRVSPLGEGRRLLLRQVPEIESQRTLGELVRLLPIPIHILDRDANVTVWNPASERTFGWSAAEVLGRPYPLAGPHVAQHRELVAASLGEGRAMAGFETTRFARDGSVVEIELWSTPIRDAFGRVVASLAATIDIGARRRAEQDFRRLFESALDAIFIFEPRDEVVLEANERACAMYGIPRSEFVGSSLQALTLDLKRGREVIDRVLEQGVFSDFRTTHRRRDGSLLQIEASATRVEYRGRLAILSINRDVTERQRLQEELQHAQKLEVVGQLAGGVAHDFNNLLTAVLGVANELRGPHFDPSSLLGLASELADVGERGRSMTSRLLGLSRRSSIEPKEVGVQEFVDQLAVWLRRLIPANIELQVEHESGPSVMRIDEMAVEQALANLVVNARDAMPNGGRLTLRTAHVRSTEERPLSGRLVGAASRAGDWVSLSVSDTGCGMDDAVLSHLFVPFFTTKGASGTGLGLAGVYGTVQQANGHVGVTSAVGEGTTFVMYLPGRPVAPPPAPADVGGLLILLVEDDALVRRSTLRILTGAGFRVVAADSAEHALELVAGGTRPHLVVSDVRMPGASGFELIQRLDEELGGVRCLMMSGYVGPDLLTPASWARPMIAKPFVPAVLIAEVQRILADLA